MSELLGQSGHALPNQLRQFRAINRHCRVRWPGSSTPPIRWRAVLCPLLAYSSRIAFPVRKARRGRHPIAAIGPADGRNAMPMLLSAASMLLAATVSAFAQSAGGAVSPDVLKDLTPTGKLRAAINLGNSVLAQTDAVTGQPKGITPDLALELGRRLGVPVELVIYDAAGKVFGAVKSGAWDIAFVAIEPVRAAEIEFSAPYVIIEGTYMVPKASPLKAVAEVDRPGVRIAVGVGSAYDLYLSRTIKNATVMRASMGGGKAMIDMFVNDKLEVDAGVKQPLEAYAKNHPEVRMIPGAFMEIQQAMGTPKGRLAGAEY